MKSCLKTTFVCLLITLFPCQADDRPNIVIMLADDMGFSDAGCYGGEIDTPNIDALAAHGLRFTQFRNCSRCCPTRASLLTGCYPHRVGLTKNGRSLTRDGVTIAEALQDVGYHTAMVGKWHLSQSQQLPGKRHQQWLDHHYEYSPFAPLDTYPTARGFEKFYGVIWGVINHFDPFSLVEGTDPIKEVPSNYYFTDAITDKAIAYVTEFTKDDHPFFLYYSQCAPHWPLHALPEDIVKYQNRYQQGWDVLRQERYQRQLALGLFNQAQAPLPPLMGREPAWHQLTPEQQAFNARKMAVHAAMIDRMDQNLGRLLHTLKTLGEFDNTVFFFLSDNGASPEIPTRPGYDRTGHTRAGKQVLYAHAIPTNLLGTELSYTGIGSSWANAANTPFRYWKKESYEGGCVTPFIVHWPKGFKNKGINHTQNHVTDIMPTCLELAKATYPKHYQGQERLDLDGQSLMNQLTTNQSTPQRTHYFEHLGGRALVSYPWKIVATAKANQWDLYNLSQDMTETKNLASQYPERVTEMAKTWDTWAEKVGVEK